MAAPDSKSGSDGVPSKIHDHDIVGYTEEARGDSGHAHSIPLTEDEIAAERKLRWKIDLMIMPLIVWTYLMNYIDRLVVPIILLHGNGLSLTMNRNNYAAARLQGLEETLGLTDTQCKMEPLFSILRA